MKATLRSVVPAVVILAMVVAVALLATRRSGEPMPPPQPWTPPAGFTEVASVQHPDEGRAELWLGRAGPPKPDDCWYVVRRRATGDHAFGGCGGTPGRPWVVRFEGVVAGGTGEDVARWVRIGSGQTIAVTQGHYLAAGTLFGQYTSIELLDEGQSSLGVFQQVTISGQGE